MSEQGSNGRLVYWLLGALLALVGILSSIAHSVMMTQLGSIEQRIGRIEGLMLKAGG